VWEQRGSSGKAPVVNLSLSSDEEDIITNVSQNEEFARRLFGDLNHDFLWPPDDDKVIILSDSDEEEKVHEEKVVDAEAAPSYAARSPTQTAFTDNADKGDAPDRVIDGSNSNRDEVGLP
jgi:hypothetical protein